MRVYAIGDVHGRADLLETLARQIRRDGGQSQRRLITVILGDVIDRGPQSREAVEILESGALPGLTALRGNHEQMLLSAIEGLDGGEMWRRNGGLETLASYGVNVANASVSPDLTAALAELRRRMPERHLLFLRSLQLCYTLGSYFFCHAGIRPGVPLDRQANHDLLWIRDEFLNSRRLHGKVVVHGHTPAERPEVLDNRINIDTGAFITGRLTCLVLDGQSRAFITT